MLRDRREGREMLTAMSALGSGRLNCHRFSVDALLGGLLFRTFLLKDGNPPPEMQSRGMGRLRNFGALMGRMHARSRLTWGEVLDFAPSSKKRMYANAAKSLFIKPFRNSDGYILPFPKVEKAIKNGHERPIQARSVRFNLMLMRYLKHNEGTCYHHVDQLFNGLGSEHPTVMKHYNAIDRASIIEDKWNRFQKPVAVGLDASRFDAHVTPELLSFEHDIYKRWFPGDKTLKRLLDCQMLNKGEIKIGGHHVKYSHLGGRMSGDINTSLGNVILMCAMVYSYLERKQKFPFEFVNDGDDCLLIVEREDLPYLRGLRNHFALMGMDLTVEDPVHCLEEIEFCRSHPVFNGERYVMCRPPMDGMYKDLSTVKNERYPHYRCCVGRSVREAGTLLHQGLPIGQELYRLLPSCARGKDVVMEYGWGRGLRGPSSHTTVTPEARASYYQAYGITPAEQIALEEKLKKIPTVECIYKRKFVNNYEPPTNCVDYLSINSS